MKMQHNEVEKAVKPMIPAFRKKAAINSAERFFQKTFFGFVFLALLAVPNSSPAFKGPDRCARITQLKGQVLWKDGAAEFEAAPLGKMVRAGERIQTLSKGKVAMTLSDGGVIRLGENSEMLIRMKRTPERDPAYGIQVILIKGKAWINLSGRTPDNDEDHLEFVVRRGILSSSQGVFRIDYFPDQAKIIKFYKGTGVISGPVDDPPITSKADEAPGDSVVEPVPVSPWRFRLSAYEQVIMRPSGMATKPFRFAAKADQDAWVRWNETQDKKGQIEPAP